MPKASPDAQVDRVRRLYDRNAALYGFVERWVSQETCNRAINLARGKVLEIGVGTGRNLAYYPAGCEVTAIDISPAMLRQARERALCASVPARVLEMDIADMSFPDSCFDTVVGTFVFCTVPEPGRALEEIRRVLKPGGRVVLLEHVRSENWLAGAVMDILNPLICWLIGDHINRRTLETVRQSGLSIDHVEDVGSSLVRLIIAGSTY